MLNLSQFELLFRQASPRLLGIAMAICRNRDSAQDVVQEAGLIAWRKRSDFAIDTNFGAWIGQIVRNLALRHNRDAYRRATLPFDERATPGCSDRPEGVETSDEWAANGALGGGEIGDQLGVDDAMAGALRGLSDDARSCFLLRTLARLSYQEIAQTLDLPQGTAMSHVHRSRKRILLILSNDPPPARPHADEGGAS